MITEGGDQIIHITDHPKLEPEIMEKLNRIKLLGTRPCIGRFGSKPDDCPHCQDRVRCAARVQCVHLKIKITETGFYFTLGEQK